MSFDLIFDYFEENIFIALSVFTFFSQIGIPLGAMFFIMYAGSTTVDLYYLSAIILTIIVFTIIGDIIAYKIGGRYGSRIINKYKHKKFVSSNYNKSKKVMDKYGSWSVFFSRFLITGIGPAINYLAGLDHYDFKKFLFFIVLGEILYATIFSSLGYFFKETWEDLLGLFSDFSVLILLLIVGFIMLKKIYMLIKAGAFKNQDMVH